MSSHLVEKLSRYVHLSAVEKGTIEALPSRLVRCQRGEILVHEGDAPHESAILVEGLALRYRLLSQGGRQILAVNVPGDFVDLHSFVLKPMDHFIGAAAPSVFAKVPHESIQTVIEKHPRLTRALMWDMALDAATGREWMVSIGRRQAYERLAHLFCELYYRMEFVGLVRNCEFPFLLTQADVADITGLSAVHVNRSLQALRKDGLLIAEDKKIRITDIKSLSTAGMFDPAYLHQLTKPEMPDPQ